MLTRPPNIPDLEGPAQKTVISDHSLNLKSTTLYKAPPTGPHSINVLLVNTGPQDVILPTDENSVLDFISPGCSSRGRLGNIANHLSSINQKWFSGSQNKNPLDTTSSTISPINK